MLKVDEAYLARSQAFIFALFSGPQGNGSLEGPGSAALCCRHMHIVLWVMVGTGQLSSRGRIALFSGEAHEACGCLSKFSLSGGVPVESPRGGKVRGKSRRLGSESQDRYISLTELLT